MVQGVRVGCFGCAWCAQVLGLWFENYPDRCCFVVGGLCFSDSNNIPWSSRGVFTKFHSKKSFLRRARCRLIIRRWRGCDVAAVELWQQYFFRKNYQDPATRCDWLIQARPLVTERCGKGSEEPVEFWFFNSLYGMEFRFPGVKRSFSFAKSLTSRQLRMRRVISQVIHFASGGCSLRYRIYWELLISVQG